MGLLSPFYRWGNWGRQTCKSNLLNVTPLVSDGAEIQSQAGLAPTLKFFSAALWNVWEPKAGERRQEENNPEIRSREHICLKDRADGAKGRWQSFACATVFFTGAACSGVRWRWGHWSWPGHASCCPVTTVSSESPFWAGKPFQNHCFSSKC